jgi:hypothetical protein
VHPSEKDRVCDHEREGAKNKAAWVITSNPNSAVNYDRQEYAARLKAAAKEVGVIGDEDSSEEQVARSQLRSALYNLTSFIILFSLLIQDGKLRKY